MTAKFSDHAVLVLKNLGPQDSFIVRSKIVGIRGEIPSMVPNWLWPVWIAGRPPRIDNAILVHKKRNRKFSVAETRDSHPRDIALLNDGPMHMVDFVWIKAGDVENSAGVAIEVQIQGHRKPVDPPFSKRFFIESDGAGHVRVRNARKREIHEVFH